jgi:hypothetical protein
MPKDSKSMDVLAATDNILGTSDFYLSSSRGVITAAHPDEKPTATVVAIPKPFAGLVKAVHPDEKMIDQ